MARWNDTIISGVLTLDDSVETTPSIVYGIEAHNVFKISTRSGINTRVYSNEFGNTEFDYKICGRRLVLNGNYNNNNFIYGTTLPNSVSDVTEGQIFFKIVT